MPETKDIIAVTISVIALLLSLYNIRRAGRADRQALDLQFSQKKQQALELIQRAEFDERIGQQELTSMQWRCAISGSKDRAGEIERFVADSVEQLAELQRTRGLLMATNPEPPTHSDIVEMERSITRLIESGAEARASIRKFFLNECEAHLKANEIYKRDDQKGLGRE